ncbi:MAG TPA: hypothetical protein PLC15_04755 [Candidatus Obscuribacter sp.]|nr:hypothetical protein [Candidatus Obscuribacter sp.]HMY02535.1 hypothetical protein [Candidatus Obscuribacter sp.]HMY54692.1 hypothetical protein [Candidatus Obscuribacter sp.]HNA73639.1 hypothetical protein [Candidatus Obscuribacter sp.]HNB14662.1 hypothetical protein [Candidatus Obscuribacter sp.]
MEDYREQIIFEDDERRALQNRIDPTRIERYHRMVALLAILIAVVVLRLAVRNSVTDFSIYVPKAFELTILACYPFIFAFVFSSGPPSRLRKFGLFLSVPLGFCMLSYHIHIQVMHGLQIR